MSIEDNARQVLLALASFESTPGDADRGHHSLEGKALVQATGLSGSALQDAIDTLDEKGLLTRHKFVGDGIGNIRLNAKGRLAAERLLPAASASALQPSTV